MFGTVRLLWLLKDLPGLIAEAETLFGPGNGPEKKQHVLDLVYKGIILAEKGAGRELADEVAVRTGLSWTIDGAVKLLNALGIWESWGKPPAATPGITPAS